MSGMQYWVMQQAPPCPEKPYSSTALTRTSMLVDFKIRTSMCLGLLSQDGI